MPQWLKTAVAIAVIVGGVGLLVLGFVFFVALVAAILVPIAVWAWASGRLEFSRPSIVEGEVVRIETALTEGEKQRLAATPVWVVWYEDQFHVGSERDSFGVAVCFSEAEAREWIARTGRRMLEPGFDGCEILGPENPLTTPLFGEQRAEILGAILERLGRGSTEPIPMAV